MAEYKESISDLRELMKDQEDAFRKQFLFLAGFIDRKVTMQLLIRQVEAGNFEEALDIIETRAEMRFGKAVSDSFNASNNLTRKFLREKTNVIVDFDAVNNRAVTQATQNKLEMVREFTDDHRKSFSRIVRHGNETGANPRVTARKMRDSLSLTAKQSQWVENYRLELEQGVPVSQLNNRALHDRRFNRTIQRAIEEGRPLTSQQINKMVKRYRTRFINYRAEVISRTESLKNVQLAKQTTYEEAIGSGQLRANQIQKKWHTTIDGRQRESHASINNEVKDFYDVFTTILGNTLAYPHDGNAPAEEVIQCRCFSQQIVNIIE